MRRAQYIERGVEMSPERLDKVLEAYENAKSITFFVQKYVLGKQMSTETRDIVVRQHQMYRIFKALKLANKV